MLRICGRNKIVGIKWKRLRWRRVILMPHLKWSEVFEFLPHPRNTKVSSKRLVALEQVTVLTFKIGYLFFRNHFTRQKIKLN